MNWMNGRAGMIVVGILAILIVVLLYLAFVGTAQRTPDVNSQDDDPTGAERVPTAYGIIHVSIQVDNAVDRYTGSITDAYVTVNDYLSFDQAAIYENVKFDLLGLFSDDMSSWVVAKISGPGQFYFEWESEHIDYSLSEWGDEYLDFSSGKCYFWDKGTYYMTVMAYADGPSGQYTIASDDYSFSVSV